MDRISKRDYYLNIASEVSKRGTCLRRNYGCIIVKNDEIISTGYTGAPRGQANCSDTGVCERQRLNIPSGQRYELCLAGDTVVKLLNGTYKTLKELCDENIKEFYVYSIDTSTGKIVPALANNPRITGYRNDIYEIELDNGSIVTCTSNHLFLNRDCTYTEAKDLKNGQSLMPMYYNFASNGRYESISNKVNARKEKMKYEWKCNTYSTPTHILVAEYNNNCIIKKNELVHHDDVNHLNNCPDNLKIITKRDHSIIHSNEEERKNHIASVSHLGRNKFIENLKTDPNKLKVRQELGTINMSNNWSNENFRENMKETLKENGKQTALKTNSEPNAIFQRGKGRVLSGISYLIFKSDNALTVENYEKIRCKFKKSSRDPGSSPPLTNTVLKYFNSLEEAIEEAKLYNHKVKSIKKLNIIIPVYDITVPNFENFAIDLGDNSCIFVHNCKSVHAEQNAIISASRKEMLGATLYLAGYDVEKGDMIQTAMPCDICSKMIINAGIKEVISENYSWTIPQNKDL